MGLEFCLPAYPWSPLGGWDSLSVLLPWGFEGLENTVFQRKGIARCVGINLFETRGLKEVFFRIQF